MAAPLCKIKTGDEVNLEGFPEQVVSFENSPASKQLDDDLTYDENSRHVVDDDSSLGDSSDGSYDTSDYSSSSCWSDSDEEGYNNNNMDDSGDNEDEDEEEGGGGDDDESKAPSVFSLDALLALQMQFNGKSNGGKGGKKDLTIFPGSTPKSTTTDNIRRMNRRKSKATPTNTMTSATTTTLTPTESTTKNVAAMKRSGSMMTFLQQDRIRRNSRLIASAHSNIAHFAQQVSATDSNKVLQPNETTPVVQKKRNSVQCKNQQVIVEKPQAHFEQILQDANIAAKTVPYDQLPDFFVPVSPEAVAAFDMTLVNAVRTQNLVELKRLYELQGRSLEARSQFGESLLHVCARRGTPELMRYMLHHAHVTFRVCCDYGRTALHDAAWSNDSQALEMMKILIHTCPDLLLIKDKRGFTPLDYIPKDRWVHACAFLDKHKEIVLPTGCLGVAATMT